MGTIIFHTSRENCRALGGVWRNNKCYCTKKIATIKKPKPTEEWTKSDLYCVPSQDIHIEQYKNNFTGYHIFHSREPKSFDEITVENENGRVVLKRLIMKKNVKAFIKRLKNKY